MFSFVNNKTVIMFKILKIYSRVSQNLFAKIDV